MKIEDLQKIQFEQEEILKENKVYDKLFSREGKKFYFLEGPPYANDIPHIGHLKNAVIKDVLIRSKFMQGFSVFFKPGFDTHGLPIENAVEKKLGLKSKKDIEALGIDNFIKICKENATLNKDLFMLVYKYAGVLFHLKQPYLTYENYYIESAWWTFKRLWEKGFVYKSKKPVHFCSHCQTSLAGYEVTDSYTTLRDPSIFILFKSKEKIKDKEAYFLVWTTTPWTLVSNVALAIREDADYALVQLTDGRNIILAESRLEILNELGYAYTLVDKIKGKELIGLNYESLLDLPVQQQLEKEKSQNQKIHTLIASIGMLKERVASKTAVKKAIETKELYEDFVNLNEGTGIVHTAGGHGKTDFEISMYYGLPCVSPLDDECKFNADAGWLEGIYVKDADAKIISYLEENNKLLHATYITHTYPVCWRCKTPLIIRLSEQYFLNIKPIKQKMISETEKVEWLPEFVKERMLNWVINAEDWNISRQRYWGIPIPLWECKCGEIKVIASLKELKEEVKKGRKALPDNFDLHNALKIKLTCDACGGEMIKIPYIFDVWFDSSVAPWASLGYPYYDEDLFDKLWPVDRINEGQDQIRGWFYVLLFSGIACFSTSPYKTVSMIGWVVDEKGEKMSKSKGNVIYAKDAIQQLGADLLRFYLLYDSPPYEIHSINLKNASKEPLKFFNTLYNLYNFYSQIGPAERSNYEEIDLWIISRLHRLIRDYTQAIENFELNSALRKLYDFVLNDLSRVYLKIIRENAEKKKILLREILENVCKLTSIVSPFFSDWLWQKLKKDTSSESIILEKWPKYNEASIDNELEENFAIVDKITEYAFSLRAENQINLRWPLTNLFIFTDDEKIASAVKRFESILKNQTNVKSIVLARVKDVTKNAREIAKGLFIALSLELSNELLAEGFAREITRHIQEARKRLGLVKENEIELEIIVDKELEELLKKYKQVNYIKGKVNATSFYIGQDQKNEKVLHEENFGVREKIITIRINKK